MSSSKKYYRVDSNKNITAFEPEHNNSLVLDLVVKDEPIIEDESISECALIIDDTFIEHEFIDGPTLELEPEVAEEAQATNSFVVGDKVKIIGSHWAEGHKVSDIVKKKTHVIAAINNNLHKVLLVSAIDANGIIISQGVCRWILTKDIQKV